VADVGPADADTNPESAALAWRNGTWVANGNSVIRHLGIPTVTVPMGTMADTRMPVGLTFAGRAYDDSALLAYAYAFEASSDRRMTPPRTPELPGDYAAGSPDSPSGDEPQLTLSASVEAGDSAAVVTIRVAGTAGAAAGIRDLSIFVNGRQAATALAGNSFEAVATIAADEHEALHSEWRAPYGSIVIALLTDNAGTQIAAFSVAGGIA
jgi:amidase